MCKIYDESKDILCHVWESLLLNIQRLHLDMGRAWEASSSLAISHINPWHSRWHFIAIIPSHLSHPFRIGLSNYAYHGIFYTIDSLCTMAISKFRIGHPTVVTRNRDFSLSIHRRPSLGQTICVPSILCRSSNGRSMHATEFRFNTTRAFGMCANRYDSSQTVCCSRLLPWPL